MAFGIGTLGASIGKLGAVGRKVTGGGGGAPSNALVAEDNTTDLVAEDGSTFLTQET